MTWYCNIKIINEYASSSFRWLMCDKKHESIPLLPFFIIYYLILLWIFYLNYDVILEIWSIWMAVSITCICGRIPTIVPYIFITFTGCALHAILLELLIRTFLIEFWCVDSSATSMIYLFMLIFIFFIYDWPEIRLCHQRLSYIGTALLLDIAYLSWAEDCKIKWWSLYHTDH
jgi:hypothetical protein